MGPGPKQLAVVSGKGGTGKTSVVASLAVLAGRCVLADCDVDAPNLHLVADPLTTESREFWGGKVAVRDTERCQGVGECERRCRFGAVHRGEVDARACEGCGLCVLACPNSALTLRPVLSGHCYMSQTEYGPLAHARLSPGGENSGRLVTEVRALALRAAVDASASLVIIDGPPGIGCSVVASMAETDLVLIVTEPTPSGIHDLDRVAELAGHFELPVYVAINRSDLSVECAFRVREHCEDRGIPLVGEIPFDESVAQAVCEGVPVVTWAPRSPAALAIAKLWARLREALRS